MHFIVHYNQDFLNPQNSEKINKTNALVPCPEFFLFIK